MGANRTDELDYPGRALGRAAGALLLLVLLSGCAGQQFVTGHDFVSGQLQHRTGYSLESAVCSGELLYGASIADGLEEEEAILLALWRNAAFHELLAELGIARSDLIQAGMLPNPEFAYFFRVPGKPFRYALDLPIEAFLLRPIRVAAAERDSQRVGQRLTQAGLDLIRDVRQAFADVLSSEGRLRIAEEAVRLRARIANLADHRLKAGDISVQEAAAARLDELQARQERIRADHDVLVAEERLRHLLALGGRKAPLRLLPSRLPMQGEVAVNELTAIAVANRPDVLAADQALAGADERARLVRVSWLRFLGILDATSGQITGHEFGPGFHVTLPIFNWNRGAIDRADAELDRAMRQKQTIRNQIVLDVRQTHERYVQAYSELQFFEDKVQPEMDAAMRRAESAFREGNTSYVVVLETSRRLLDSRLREEQLRAEVRRTWAELERSVGRRIDRCDDFRPSRRSPKYQGGRP